ncbi:MAG TPA: hypothetical protein ENN79_12180, partial [Desulfobacteraceae bacterium]|nr:hypothetical protein [Desulfobacteraceae bacterium]
VSSGPTTETTGRYTEQTQAVVSGKVTDAAGNPVPHLLVLASAGLCQWEAVASAVTDDTGDYRFEDLEPGNYYLRTCTSCEHKNYVDIWYDQGYGTINCGEAAPVPVEIGTTQENVDFTIVEGPRRTTWQQVTVGDNKLGCGFAVNAGFRESLVSAVLSIPNESRSEYPAYTFDLTGERILWDSECRFLDYWHHIFGPLQPEDYGAYTLTLTFAGGETEVYHMVLEPNPVVGVDPDTITVEVLANGGAWVGWQIPTENDQDYQVRIGTAGETYKELFRSGSMRNANGMELSRNDLRCLEPGQTYLWRVRAFPAGVDTWQATSAVVAPYDPAGPINRIHGFTAQIRNDRLFLEVIPYESVIDRVTGINVNGPGDFNYQMDLETDWYDLSSEARLFLKGWSASLAFPADLYGTYTFEVFFDDGTSQIMEHSLNEPAMLPSSVDFGSLQHYIHPDGAVTFSWENPGLDQRYQVRIRSADGSREHCCSVIMPAHQNSWTVSSSNLRTLIPGDSYAWFLRAYDPSFNAMTQTQSVQFVYDPFGHAGSAGSLIMSIEPEEAVDAGAGWRRAGTEAWLESGYIEVLDPGDYNVEFKPIPGWNTPENQTVTVSSGFKTDVIGVYTAHMLGDVNADDKIDLTDAILALQVISGMSPAGAVHSDADIDGDGRIGLNEAVFALQVIGQIEDGGGSGPLPPPPIPQILQ